MSREIISFPSDYQDALDRLFEMARESISIFEVDGQFLRLEDNKRLELVRRFLQGASLSPCLRLAVRDGEAIRRKHPRLLQLLGCFGHIFSARQTSASLAHLRDTMILVDGRHGLIRFDLEQARSKLLIDETEELRPYYRRFEEIWSEQAEEITATTLGL